MHNLIAADTVSRRLTQQERGMPEKQFGSVLRFSLVVVLCVISFEATAIEVSAELEANILRRIERRFFPGMIIGIVDEQGPRYYGYGETALGDGNVPDKDTVYEIGSITKTFTGVMLADMSQQGELDLDSPVQAFLPDSVTIPQRNGAQITLAHLSTHHSGLPRMPDNFSPANNLNPYADYSVQNMYDFLSGYTLTRDIGATGEYSNLGVGLLGHALTEITDQDYESLVAERILQPLSMESTGISLSDSMAQRLAPPYAAANGLLLQVQNWDIPTFAGAGALRSTAEDMLHYIEANAGLVDSPLNAALELSHLPRENFGGGTASIGLGWIISGEGDDAYHWHNGGTGGYRSFAGFSVADRAGVVVIVNSSRDADDIGHHLLNSDSALRDPEPKDYVEVTLEEAQLQRLAGSYQLAPEFILNFSVEDGRFYIQATGQPKFEVFAESETEFFLKVVEAELTFELDEAGAATRVTLFQNGQTMPGDKIDQ